MLSWMRDYRLYTVPKFQVRNIPNFKVRNVPNIKLRSVPNMKLWNVTNMKLRNIHNIKLQNVLIFQDWNRYYTQNLLEQSRNKQKCIQTYHYTSIHHILTCYSRLIEKSKLVHIFFLTLSDMEFWHLIPSWGIQGILIRTQMCLISKNLFQKNEYVHFVCLTKYALSFCTSLFNITWKRNSIYYVSIVSW